MPPEDPLGVSGGYGGVAIITSLRMHERSGPRRAPVVIDRISRVILCAVPGDRWRTDAFGIV
jgi:hypothetical protein